METDNLEPQNPQAPETDGSVAASLKRILSEESGEDLVEDEAPEPAPDTEETPKDDAEEAPPEEETPPPATDEFADVELDGKVYKVPAPLKDGYLRQADYTRKTMDLATQREAAEALLTVNQQAYAVVQQLGPVLAKFHDAKAKAEQYGKVDWDTLYQEDPMLHNKLRFEAQDTLQEVQKLGAVLQQAPSMLEAVQSQSLAAEVQRNLPIAKQLVPNFDSRKDELAATGKLYGFTEQELRTTPDARAMRVLHDLGEYQKLVAGREKVRQQVASAPPTAKPGARTSGQVPSTKEYKSALQNLRSDSSNDAVVAALRAQRKTRGN